MQSTLENEMPQAFAARRNTPSTSKLLPPITPPQSPPLAALIDECLDQPEDIGIPDNYVQHTLRTVPPLPPITLKSVLAEVEWISFLALTIPPIIGTYGAFTTTLQWKTALFAVFWYFVTG